MSDIAVPENVGIIDTRPSWQLGYDELARFDGAWQIDSNQLFNSDAKPFLLGVPFIITALTFRPIPPTKVNPNPRDYVSVEAIIASEDVLERELRLGRVPNFDSLAGLESVGVEPELRIVFNDGSTGVRRQLVMMLHTAGVIDAGGDKSMGGAQYDQWYGGWTHIDQWTKEPDGESLDGVPHITMTSAGKPLVIKCKRGLRASTYENENTDNQEVTTYYLA
jgi:hypothetical protein